jgi:hypothetical protein
VDEAMDVCGTAKDAGGTVDGLVNKPQANDATNSTVNETRKALRLFVVRSCILIIEPSLVYTYHTVPIVTIQLPINQLRIKKILNDSPWECKLITKISYRSFTAMERLTGWHASVMMGFQGRGKVDAGARPVELAVPAPEFMDALRKRGVQFEVR